MPRPATLLAQAAGPELLLSFDRPRDAACTVANVRAPAVVAQKVLYPPDARAAASTC